VWSVGWDPLEHGRIRWDLLRPVGTRYNLLGHVTTRWNLLEHVRTCWDTFGPVGTRFQEVISLSYPEKLDPHGFIINNILWIRKINGFQLCLYRFLTKKSRNSKHILVWSVKWDPLDPGRIRWDLLKPIGTRYNLLGHVTTRWNLLEHVRTCWYTFGPVGTRFQEVISLSYPEKLDPHGFIINNILFSCAPDSAEGTGSSGLLVFPVLSGPPPPMCTGWGGR